MTHDQYVPNDPTPRKRNWVAIALALALSLSWVVFATYALHNKPQAADTAVITIDSSGIAPVGDPYRNWPPAGTKPAPPGETLFEAQGIIALTCRNGKAHIDENMVVGSTLRPDVKPSWFVDLNVSYDQSRKKGFCEVKYQALGKATVLPLSLYTDMAHVERGLSGFASTGLTSHDGPSSIIANTASQPFSVLLVNTGDKRVEPGVPIKLNDHNTPSPARDLLKS